MKLLMLKSPKLVRVEVAFGEWLHTLGYAASTAYYAPLHVREFFAYLERRGITDLGLVGGEPVETYFYLLSRRVNTRRGGGLSRAYLLKHRQALRLLSRYLIESGQGGFRVTPAVKRKVPHSVTVLTEGEMHALYAACDDDALGRRDRAMLGLFYGCGLRRSEGVGLDVEDVLLERDLLYIRHGKNYRERYVPLTGLVAYDLSVYLRIVRPVWAASGEVALLVTTRGRRIGGRGLLLRLNRLQDRAADEVPALLTKTVGLHTLRHSLATHLLERGMSLEQIAQILGHRSLESTQRYTHLMKEPLYPPPPSAAWAPGGNP